MLPPPEATFRKLRLFTVTLPVSQRCFSFAGGPARAPSLPRRLPVIPPHHQAGQQRKPTSRRLLYCSPLVYQREAWCSQHAPVGECLCGSQRLLRYSHSRGDQWKPARRRPHRKIAVLNSYPRFPDLYSLNGRDTSLHDAPHRQTLWQSVRRRNVDVVRNVHESGDHRQRADDFSRRASAVCQR